MKYLWDTNTVIYYLQQQFSIEAEKFVDDIIRTEQPVLSAITEIELLCWKAASEKDIEVVNNFINDVLIIELEQAIKLKAVKYARGIKLNYRMQLSQLLR